MSKKEDIISLNPQFLSFLMAPEKADLASKEFTEALNLLASQNIRNFDPFDKVVLSNKGIDNPILTSFRTLAKTNNSLSDTFKIIHNKFSSNESNRKSAFFNRKKAEGKTKSYLLNPPPDLSGIDEHVIRINEELMHSTDQSLMHTQEGGFVHASMNRSNDLSNTIAYSYSKTTTAQGAARAKLYDSVDRGFNKSKPFLKSLSKAGLGNYSTIHERDYYKSEKPKTRGTTVPVKPLFDNKDIHEAAFLEMVNDASVILPE